MSIAGAPRGAWLLGLALAAVGCGPEPDDGSSERGACRVGATFATAVVAFEFGEPRGATVGQGPDEFPDRVLGGPRGGGCCAGSTDVTTLGNGGWVVLEFDGTVIVDGDGPDFLVAENPFWIGGEESRVFAELATVSVSDDATTWVEFPCTATRSPFGQCAGWRPVFASVDRPDDDPFDATAAGGDAFDLADVGVERARYVRVTDRPDLDGDLDGAFDLDAVTVLHGACP